MSIEHYPGVNPADIFPQIVKVISADTAIAAKVKYIGSEASGTIDIANSTGDITLKHGASGSEAADTDFNPDGGTPGTADLSDEATTWQALKLLFDDASNWELIPVAYLPTDATEASDTGKIVNNISGAQCKIDGGYSLYFDRSATLYHSAGITHQDQSSEPHGSDASVLNELTLIGSKLTYSSGTHQIKVYEVDDIAGSETQIGGTYTCAATTVQLWVPNSGDPTVIQNTRGKRLVVKQVSSTAEPTAWDLEVHGRSIVIGPAVRKSKMWQNLCG